MRKITILVLSSPSFSRIVKHLFRDRSEFEVVGALCDWGDLSRESGRLPPELIVAHVKPLSIRICQLVATIKKTSPLSKLILICPVEDLMSAARKCGADACLNDEKLTGRLVRAARALADRPQIPGAGD